MSALRSGLALAGLLAIFSLAGAAEESSSLADALRDGRPILDLRYRYETVTDDSVAGSDARASTLRTVFGYRSGVWKGWGVHLEGEDVSVLGNDLYNNVGFGDADNGVRDRPVVADPAGTGINQAFLSYTRDDFGLKLGRQEIVLADSRFLGNVGWRQNHQSFDALRISTSDLGPLALDYAYIRNASRINASNHEMSSHLLHGALELSGGHRLRLYGLLLDYRDPPRWGLSTRTLGGEITGTVERQSFKLSWEAEVAYQTDAGDNPDDVDARYLHLLIGATRGKVTGKVGYEVLGGSAEDGQFGTPLATLHKFNGWADKFLVTPTNGLEDLYLSLAGKVRAIAWTVVFHDFASETGSLDYGRELDLLLLRRAPWGQSFGLKAALYDADGFSADTTKWMLFTSFSI